MTKEAIIEKVGAQNEYMGRVLREFLDNVYTDEDRVYIKGYTQALYHTGIITFAERDILRGVAEAEVGKP